MGFFTSTTKTWSISDIPEMLCNSKIGFFKQIRLNSYQLLTHIVTHSTCRDVSLVSVFRHLERLYISGSLFSCNQTNSLPVLTWSYQVRCSIHNARRYLWISPLLPLMFLNFNSKTLPGIPLHTLRQCLRHQDV